MVKQLEGGDNKENERTILKEEYEDRIQWLQRIGRARGERMVEGREGVGEVEEEVVPCTSWIYDTSVFSSTVSMEWDLVCDRAGLSSLFQTLYTLGCFCGAILTGVTADRYGRRWSVRAGLCGTLVGVVLLLGTPWLPVVLGARLLLGLANTLMVYPAFILSMEVCGPELRPKVGVMLAVPYALMMVTLAGLAYVVRDWRLLQALASFPCLLMLPLLYLVDESPRWLLVQGRVKETVAILRRGATMNRVTLPKALTTALLAPTTVNSATSLQKDEEGPKLSFTDNISLLSVADNNLYSTNSENYNKKTSGLLKKIDKGPIYTENKVSRHNLAIEEDTGDISSNNTCPRDLSDSEQWCARPIESVNSTNTDTNWEYSVPSENMLEKDALSKPNTKTYKCIHNHSYQHNEADLMYDRHTNISQNIKHSEVKSQENGIQIQDDFSNEIIIQNIDNNKQTISTNQPNLEHNSHNHAIQYQTSDHIKSEDNRHDQSQYNRSNNYQTIDHSHQTFNHNHPDHQNIHHNDQNDNDIHLNTNSSQYISQNHQTNDHNHLNSNNSHLNSDHTHLNSNPNHLNSDHNHLNSTPNHLNADHNHLNSNPNHLNSDHTHLNSSHIKSDHSDYHYPLANHHNTNTSHEPRVLGKDDGRGSWYAGPLALVRTPVMRRLMLILVVMWILQGVVYLGLPLSSDSFSSPFLYMGLMGVVEIPAYTLTAPITARLGRRAVVVFCLLVCGLLLLTQCATMTSVRNEWVSLALVLASYLLVCTAYQVNFLYAPELLPTTLRPWGTSMCTLAAYLGFSIPPIVTDYLAKDCGWVTPAVFGVCGLAAGCLALLLPETNGRHLPETVADLTDRLQSEKLAGKRKTATDDLMRHP